MPDAWTILKENSSLGSGDAWEHLNNQEGGGGVGQVVSDLAGTSLSEMAYMGIIDETEELAGAVEETTEIESTIEELEISTTITEENITGEVDNG